MIKKYFSYPLRPFNTFGVDVKAANFFEFESEEELVELIEEGLQKPLLVIGGGSNLLFMKDYEGTVLHSCITGIDVVAESKENVLLRVGSGVCWDELVAYTIERGWQGLENLSAIPGEVGASAVQNVGAYGVEAGEFIERVDTISLEDGTKRCFADHECRFGYRDSIFKHEEKDKNVVTYVTFRLQKKPEYRIHYGDIKERVKNMGGVTPFNIRCAVCDIRAAKLPDTAVLGSAGSFFVNPIVPNDLAKELAEKYPIMPQYPRSDGNGVKLSAAWLIEQCGWKGKSIGNVGVYKNQALVIVNLGGATGPEILEFSEQVCKSVKDLFGVELHHEVNVIE